MPTYEYHCKKCNFRFEYFQGIKESPLKKCPECGGDIERLIGKGSGIVFKGSGFYETDYKRKGEKTTKKKPEPAVEKPAKPAS